MVKLSFSLFLATLAVANGARELRTSDDEIFPPTDKPVCPEPVVRRNLKTSKSKDSGSSCTPITVTCGQTLSGPRALKGNLACNDLTDGQFALKLSGADAVLDCAGFNVFATGGKVNSGTMGIVLENGATVKNCATTGFQYGYVVGAGDNSLESSVSIGNDVGVKTTGKGCNTIKGVAATGNDSSGFVIQGSGTLIFADNKANANNGNNGGDAGVTIATPKDDKLEMVVENLLAMGNRNEGFYVDNSDSNNSNAGKFRGMFYGSNYLLGNGDDGIENRNDDGKIAIIGTLNADGNEEGVDARAGKITLEETSVLTACSNDFVDIRNEFIVDKSTTNTTCDTRQATQGNILCPSACPDIDTVVAC